MNAYKIFVTRKADKDELDIYNYIAKKFGQIYAENFRSKLTEFFKMISRQPFIGRPAKNDASLRVYIFSKQNKLFIKSPPQKLLLFVS